jgi:hypothetical protein
VQFGLGLGYSKPVQFGLGLGYSKPVQFGLGLGYNKPVQFGLGFGYYKPMQLFVLTMTDQTDPNNLFFSERQGLLFPFFTCRLNSVENERFGRFGRSFIPCPLSIQYFFNETE